MGLGVVLPIKRKQRISVKVMLLYLLLKNYPGNTGLNG